MPYAVDNLTLTGTAAINGTGNDADNSLTGNSASNILTGGAGNDKIDGGAGTDTANYADATNPDGVVVNLNLTAPQDTGNGLDTLTNLENLTGSTYDDSLIGNAGPNQIDGGKGGDFMVGGTGDDVYLVDNRSDAVIENPSEGSDTVRAAISYQLPANLESLTLTGSRNLAAVGNELNNVIQGNAGSNLLDGGAGNDIASFTNATQAVNASLAAKSATGFGTDTLLNFENLTGSNFNDTLTGDGNANTLNGGAGADVLTGGGGADGFVFSTTSGGTDKTLDFVSGTDKLQIKDGTSFLGIGNGDHIINGGVAVVGPGGFSNTAELVIVTNNIAGAITTASAAAAIGSASATYATGDNRLFAVDNGTDSALFLFKSAGADATVGATELTLVGTLQGTASTTLADYAFA